MSVKKRPAGGHRVQARLSAIDTDRLRQLMEFHGVGESDIVRDALIIKWYLDIGFGQLHDAGLLMREADVITDFGRNDPGENNA